jgi:hypothetical protein
VVNPGGTIGRRRAFKKSKGLGSLSVGDGFFENLVFFPILKDRFPDVWVVYLFKFLVRFHCVYSGELEEKNARSRFLPTLVGSSIAFHAMHPAQNKGQR